MEVEGCGSCARWAEGGRWTQQAAEGQLMVKQESWDIREGQQTFGTRFFEDQCLELYLIEL
jgi:hypothetical protein